MTNEEAIRCLSVHSSTNGSGLCTDEQHYEAKEIAIRFIEAWDKVLSDLEKANENYSEKYGFKGGILAAKDIINKHLNGIAE